MVRGPIGKLSEATATCISRGDITVRQPIQNDHKNKKKSPPQLVLPTGKIGVRGKKFVVENNKCPPLVRNPAAKNFLIFPQKSGEIKK